MVDSEVKVRFTGDASGLTKATASATDGLNAVGLAAGAVAATIGGVFAVGTAEFIKFDNAIKQSGVVSGTFGTPQISALRDEVERLGIVTSKSPAEVGEMSVALSRAGFSAEESAAALEGIVRASEATGSALLNVGDITAKTIRTFGLAADESGRVGDILVATANNTNTTVESIGESLAYVGPVAAAANQPLEDIALAIGILGDAGIDGSRAGTNLSAALERLNIASAAGSSQFAELGRGTELMATAFDAIGGEVRDANGQLLPLSDILSILRENMDKLGQADKEILFKTLFGVEGQRAMLTLLNATEERVGSVSEAINNSAGVSERSGQAMLQGLGGALDLLGGSASAAASKFGEFVAIGLEPLVRGATSVLNAFLALPGPIQKVLIGTTGFVGVLAGAVATVIAFNAAIALTGPGLIALGTQLGIVVTGATGAALSVTGLGLAIAGVGDAALAALAKIAPLAIQLGLIVGAAAAVAAAFKRTEGANFAQDISKATDELVKLRGETENITTTLDDTTNRFDKFQESLSQGRGFEAVIRLFQDAETASSRFGNQLGLISADQRGAQLAQMALNETLETLGGSIDSASNFLLKYGENIPADKLAEFNAGAKEQSQLLQEEIDLLTNQLGASEELDQQINSEIAIRERLLETIKSRLDTDTAEQLELETEATKDLTAALEGLSVATDAAGAALDISLNQQLQSIRQNQLDEVISAEEAAEQISAVEQNASRNRLGILQEELNKVRELRRESADDPELLQREQELAAEVGDIQLGLLEEQVRAQEELAQAEEQRVAEANRLAEEAAAEQIRLAEEAAQAEKEARIEAIQETAIARQTAADAEIRAINRAIQSQESLNNAQQSQIDLARAATYLRNSLDESEANSLDIAARLTEDEGERARLQEQAAELRLESLQRAQQNEDIILELQLAQERTQRQIEASRLRAQQAQAQADIAAAEAAVQVAIAEGASQVQIDALQSQVAASREAAAALQLQSQELANQAIVQEQLASVRREQQEASQFEALRDARINVAESQDNDRDRERLLARERSLALESAAALQRQSSTIPQQLLPQLAPVAPQLPNVLPQQQLALAGAGTSGPVTINQTNNVEVRPGSTAAAQTDFEQIALNAFNGVATKLQGLVRN